MINGDLGTLQEALDEMSRVHNPVYSPVNRQVYAELLIPISNLPTMPPSELFHYIGDHDALNPNGDYHCEPHTEKYAMGSELSWNKRKGVK